MKTLILFFSLLSGAAIAAPIKLSHQLVTFAPTKTAEVGRAFLGIRCLREASSWEDLVNVEKTLACNSFKVNGVSMSKYQYEKTIELKKLGPNQFQLDSTSVSFSTAKKGHVCVRLIATLESGSFAAKIDDWSVLGYCSVATLPFYVDREIYDNRRVKTLNNFKNALFNPITLTIK